MLVGAWEHSRSSPNAHTKAITPQTIETLNFYLCTPVSLSSSSLVGATVKAGTQERGTERGTEVRCKERRK